MMTKSMTGFAAAEGPAGQQRVSWELRSVNHRFLDISLRLPDEFKHLEQDCRNVIRDCIGRGKVDATLRLSLAEDAPTDWRLNQAALDRLEQLSRGVEEHFAVAGGMTVAQILRFPGVLDEPQLDAAAMAPDVLAALGGAVTKLDESRAREGSQLQRLILERCDQIDATVLSVRGRLGEAEKRYWAKLRERLARLDVEANPERLEAEMVMLAQRLDVAEELDRLVGHVVEIRSVFQRAEPIGRRLDFLMQELNREANTLGSKAADEALTRDVVELKVLVEQMREQVQNIE
jgi:uncharacterized protein (TIGR00255 family)